MYVTGPVHEEEIGQITNPSIGNQVVLLEMRDETSDF